MNRLEAFRILEIDVTDDKKAIKKAYAELVKQYHPEEYPEKWQEIHEAYETALKGAEIKQQPFSIYMDDDGRSITFVYSGTALESDELDNIKQEKKSEWEEWEAYKENERKSEERQQERQEDYRELEREKRERRREEWEDYRQNEQKSEEQKQDEWESKIEEDQEIHTIFDNMDELIQEKRKQEREEQAQREHKREKIKKRKAWEKKIAECGICITIFACLFGLYEQKIKEYRTKEVVEQKINSVEDYRKMQEEQQSYTYRNIYLPALTKSDEELQKSALEHSICLQEGIYLTVPDNTEVYHIYEADVPKQFWTFTDGGVFEGRAFAFCVSSSEEPKCRPIWFDMEKLGFGAQARIFYYDEDQEKYVEREWYQQGADPEQCCYAILDYRVIIIDTHVHEEGETCEHPIVLISY